MTETTPLKVQMTVQEALSKLKMIDARIAKKTAELEPLAATIEMPAGYKNEQEYLDDTRSRWTSLFALMRYRDNVRAAITLANSQTLITIGANKLTVTVALNLKRGLVLRDEVLTHLEDRINTMKAKWDVHHRRVEAQADQQVKALLGDTKPDAEEYKAMHKAYIERNSKKLYVEGGLLNQLSHERDQLDKFMASIDHILTTSNVNTVIEVDGTGAP